MAKPVTTTGFTTAFSRAVLIGMLASILALVTSRSDLLLFAAPYFAFVLLASRPLKQIPVSWQAPFRRLHSGETVPVNLEFADTNQKLINTVALPKNLNAGLKPISGSVATCQTLTEFKLSPHRWGTYELGPGLAVSHDRFGAWRSVTELPKIKFNVLPQAGVMFSRSGVANPIGISGAHTSPQRGDGSVLAEVRPFQSGDRLRHINWRVTSRTGKLHTNSHFTDLDTEVLVIADTTSIIASRDPSAPTSIDLGVQAITAVSRFYLDAGDRVALHDFGAMIDSVPYGTGMRNYSIIMDSLSRARRDLTRTAKLRPIHRIRSGTLVFVVSNLLQENVINQIMHLLAMGGQVLVIDTLPPHLGENVSAESKRKQKINAVVDHLIADDAARWFDEAWLWRRLQREETIQQLKQLGAPVVPWTGPNALVDVLPALAHAARAPRRRR